MIERSMVDANVLIFAFRQIKPKDSDTLREWHEASIQLLRQMSVIRVCSIAWMEFMRGLRPNEREAQRSLYAKVQPEMVDGRVADRAIDLLNARNIREKLCRHCNNALDAHPCPACKRLVSSKQNLNDAIVVAAAELTADVDTLYCYDSGVGDFAKHMDAAKCMLAQPPNPIGPLFDRRGK